MNSKHKICIIISYNYDSHTFPYETRHRGTNDDAIWQFRFCPKKVWKFEYHTLTHYVIVDHIYMLSTHCQPNPIPRRICLIVTISLSIAKFIIREPLSIPQVIFEILTHSPLSTEPLFNSTHSTWKSFPFGSSGPPRKTVTSISLSLCLKKMRWVTWLSLSLIQVPYNTYSGSHWSRFYPPEDSLNLARP